MEQVINWRKAVLSGILGAICMAAFVDVFYMLDLIPFTFEHYFGSLFGGTALARGHRVWLLGAAIHLGFGAVFGIVYAFLLENALKRTSPRIGASLGVAHGLLAGVFLFPFFGLMRTYFERDPYAGFGFLGVGLGFGMLPLILAAHAIFGYVTTMSYGSIGNARRHERFAEPGTIYPIGDRRALTEKDSPSDRVAS